MLQEGYLTDESSFGQLFSSYVMSRDELEQWVSLQPWKFKLYDMAFVDQDSKRLKFAEREVAYVTEMASDGGQLRVYFRDGVMYVSYNVM